MTELLDSKAVTARKRHRCDDCGGPIEPGDRYRRATCLGDGTVWTWRDCTPCADLIDVIWDYYEMHTGDDIGPETFAEWAQDNLTDERAVAYLARRELASAGGRG